MHSILIIGLFVVGAFSAPKAKTASFVANVSSSPQTYVSSKLTYRTQFDDLKSNDVAVQGDDVPIPYDALAYNQFNARASGVSIERAHSPPNDAAVNFLNTRLQKQEVSISSVYPKTNVSSFDIKSMYLGCALTTEASTGVPQVCTVNFNGTKAVGGSVEAQCSYKGTVLKPALELCTFPSTFTGLTKVVFDAQALEGPVVYIDDVSYTVYYK